ncbi:hypothetical protein PVAND_010976 [Polypedilum vanderplanki]|uniref:Cadherin domain-containing protein n=1 Tax=Polypedilum vanderplanki TaxID=319348 RepID=A0A9J6CHP5_POLVA|nr:hypothetical protein PVAND_010976 [Polypedilum vanderplanki]
MIKFIYILSFFALNLVLVESAENKNKPPYFLSGSDFTSFSIPENFQVGTSVYKLKGIDPEGKKISYSISGPYFSVERETGIVKLIKELDRETQKEIETIITITDEADGSEEPNTVSLRRIIPIRDYNDFFPTFLGRPYSAEIVETANVGQILKTTEIIVIDRDEGVNSEVTVSCHRDNQQQQQHDSCDYFGISTVKRTEGNYTIELRLLKPLDYETKNSYSLTIVAKDGSRDNPLQSNATINIKIIDAQDQPPLFNGMPYTASVEENLKPNVSILLINATDGDIGSPNDVILSLEKEKFGYFKLLKNGKGLAHLATSDIPIDRENPEIVENGGYYTFYVRATEILKNHSLGDSSITSITIMIKDIDDNSPEFNQPFFNLTIPENLAQGMALPKLSIIVNDRDVGSNSEYNLTISNVENADGIFDIFPKSSHGRTQVLVRVKNSTRLDYDVPNSEMRTFIFDIIATINFIPISKTTIEIHLDDVNDNFPTFVQSNYRLQVSENAEMGSKIGNVFAFDDDAGEKYGKISYSLRGFGSEKFETAIDEGGIYVKNTLDYEQQKSYSLSLIARDGGNRESNANIYIDVLDINDNYPQFEMTEYYRSIRDGSKSFEPQFFVKANDADGPTQGNGKILYFIESENSISGHVFNINNDTGEISIQSNSIHSNEASIDGSYELMICAMDFGVPSLKNYTKVIIRVGSENQRPVFQGHFASSFESVPGPPFYRISIYENATVNSNLTMVQAIDPDGDDKLLSYRIMEPSDSFVIDERTGVIKISPYARLDRDSADSYSIIVNAIDSGIPSETSTVTIKVKILDTNNKKPKFRKASYTAYVPERNKGLEVIKVEASDSDLDSKLKYTIVEPVMATTKTGYRLDSMNFDYQSIFQIDENTGSIMLLKNLESSGLYSITLTVKVQDMNGIDPMEQTDTSEVILYVQSYKESGPIFLNDEWNLRDKKISLKINEELPIGTVIFEFKASDPYMNEEIYDFDMENQEYFRLQENKLIISKVIDYENIEKIQFKFDVKAISHDSFSIAHVSIEILNVNDNSPTFEKNEYKVAILENIKENEIILKVKATDEDKIKNSLDKTLGFSHITYSLSGANSPMFVINDVGEIRLAKNQYLDRERQPSVIQFQIVAEDSFGKPLTMKKSFANVTIEVLDVNDSAPKFLNTMKNGIINAVISESSLPNTLIAKLEAYDADEGLNAQVRFEFINEGELTKLLTLNAKTGELKTLKFLTGRGRFEPYEVVVRAIDNGNLIPKQQSLFTDQILHIFIGDTFQNDGTPFFTNTEDEASIYENSPVGTKVYQVFAKDPDDPQTLSGMLRYRIQDDIEDAKYFKIEALTGVVTNTRVLDREVKSKYNVIVEVSDQGEPIQIATRVLKIEVLDVDDEEPTFIREVNSKPIEMAVLEEQSSGIILGNVTAIDKDIGENGAIDYAIVDGNELGFFKLIIANNSALITTTKPIDREEFDRFLLTIKCFKMTQSHNNGRQRSAINYARNYDVNDLSQIQVLIVILDIDDHELEFERKNYMIGIRNTIPINTVIYKVRAYDKDSENSPIKYHFSNNTQYVSQYYRKDSKYKDDIESIFKLNKKTGEILLAKSVSDYVDGHFVLHIHASNNQFSDSEATVKIFVIRDKSIMKFVFSKTSPVDIEQPNSLSKFAEKLQEKMNTSEIEIVTFDAQVLYKPDKALDFTSTTSSCFKLLRNGNSLSTQETKKILNSEEMKNRLRETYLEYSVDSIDLCSFSSESSAQISSIMSSSGNWLVFLALLVLIASLCSTLAAFCLFRRAEMSMKSPILHHRISNPDIYNGINDIGAPHEPIYTIM